jgi:hypothetical protein
MSIGLKSDSSGTSGSIVINGSDKVVVTSAGNVTAGTFTGAVVGAVTGNVTGNVAGTLTAGGSLTSGTAVASTGGTAIDFTSIPSWAKRITVMFNAVSTNGVSPFEMRIGSGSIDSTGYASGAFTPNSINTASTTGFILTAANYVAALYAGSITLLLQNPASYTWVSSGVISDTATPSSFGGGNSSGGVKTLSGVLDRIRITTTGGANTFDNGSVNIMYEG